jgi:hypothetical protein
MAKARRGRQRVRPPAVDVGGARQHFRADGAPKTRYDSADAANRASFHHRMEDGIDLVPYRCDHCGGWHLGSAAD